MINIMLLSEYTPTGTCTCCRTDGVILPFHIVDYQDEIDYAFHNWDCLELWIKTHNPKSL